MTDDAIRHLEEILAKRRASFVRAEILDRNNRRWHWQTHEPLVDSKDAKDAGFTFYRTKNHNKVNFHSNPTRKETENHEPRTITNS